MISKAITESPYTIQKRLELQRRFLDDPIRNEIIRTMSFLTVFQSITMTMKDGELIDTERRWNNKQAEETYRGYEKLLADYSMYLTRVGHFATNILCSILVVYHRGGNVRDKVDIGYGGNLFLRRFGLSDS